MAESLSASPPAPSETSDETQSGCARTPLFQAITHMAPARLALSIGAATHSRVASRRWPSCSQ